MLVSSCTTLLIYLLNLLICKDLDGTKQWSTGFRFDENCCAPLISWIVIVWLFFVQTPFYSVNWLIGWKTSTNFSSNWRDHMLTSCFVNSRSTMLEQLILLSERESCYFWTCFFFSFFFGLLQFPFTWLFLSTLTLSSKYILPSCWLASNSLKIIFK